MAQSYLGRLLVGSLDCNVLQLGGIRCVRCGFRRAESRSGRNRVLPTPQMWRCSHARHHLLGCTGGRDLESCARSRSPWPPFGGTSSIARQHLFVQCSFQSATTLCDRRKGPAWHSFLIGGRHAFETCCNLM